MGCAHPDQDTATESNYNDRQRRGTASNEWTSVWVTTPVEIEVASPKTNKLERNRTRAPEDRAQTLGISYHQAISHTAKAPSTATV